MFTYRSRPEPSLKYLGIVSVRERPNAPTPVAGGFSEKDDLPVAGTGPCDVSCDMYRSRPEPDGRYRGIGSERPQMGCDGTGGSRMLNTGPVDGALRRGGKRKREA